MARKSFYLVKRHDRVLNGKPVYYVRFRQADGTLPASSGISTGATSKTAAELVALQKLKEGTTTGRGSMTFAGFSTGWWTDTHPYVKGRRARGRRLSPVYLGAMRGYLDLHIVPTFGAMLLSRITAHHIERWLVDLPEKDGISATTANRCRACLSIMLDAAARERLIAGNPVPAVPELVERPTERGVFLLPEIRRLFNTRTIKRVWAGSRRLYTFHMVACVTGARLGELQALAVEDVHENHIALTHAWDRRAGRREGTKSGPGRVVPIPEKVGKALHTLVDSLEYHESSDLLFVGARRGVPVEHTMILRSLRHALAEIGVPLEAQRERRLVVHSWRHTLNTMLRVGKVADPLVRRVTGHSTEAMSQHYTTFSLPDFKPVAEIQTRILG